MSKGIGHRTLKVPGPWNVTGLQVLLHHHDFSKLTLFPYTLTKAFIPSLQAHTLNYAKACVCPTLQTLLVVSFACGLLCTAGCHFVRHEAITWADLQRWSRSIWCLYFFFFFVCGVFFRFYFLFYFFQSCSYKQYTCPLPVKKNDHSVPICLRTGTPNEHLLLGGFVLLTFLS